MNRKIEKINKNTSHELLVDIYPSQPRIFTPPNPGYLYNLCLVVRAFTVSGVTGCYWYIALYIFNKLNCNRKGDTFDIKQRASGDGIVGGYCRVLVTSL